MPELMDTFSFDKGLNTRKNSVVLQEGELQECNGFAFENDGYLKPLKPRLQVHHSPYGQIRNIHRYQNHIIMAEGENIRYKWDMRGYCDRYIPADEEFTTIGTGTANRYRMVDYRDWVFMVNGHANRLFSRGALYPWGVDAPTSAPGGSAGASGNPSGTYSLYYTYLVTFPNGEQVESAPSPAGSVTVTSKKIEWTGIGICQYNSANVKISRILYRYSSTLGATYEVIEIGDNTTTTYSDDEADGTIQLNPIISTEDYDVPQDPFTDIDLYLQRVFGIKGTYLYWSEAYLPFNFKTSSDINVSTVGEDLVGVRSWGEQLYIPSRQKWYRLYGDSANTWGIKTTYTDRGVINTNTIDVTRYGILGMWYDGIYLFDGSFSKNITEKQIGRKLFTDTISNTDACYSEWDGAHYYFYYPTSGSVLDNCLIIDFAYYPNLRFYNDPFIATAHEYHFSTGRRYLARLD